MTELASLLEAAFVRVWEGIKGDRGEVMRRLGRRRKATLMRVPRATCVTLRADDTRLDELVELSEGIGEGEGECAPATVRPGVRRGWLLRTGRLPGRHEVEVTKELLGRLCAPVVFEGAVSVREAARRLGIGEAKVYELSAPRWAVGYTKGRKVFVRSDARGGVGILPHQKELLEEARRRGIVRMDSADAKQVARGRYRVRVEPIEEGMHFDPCAARVGSSTDAGYGPLWLWNVGKVSEGFEQTLVRVRVLSASGRPGWRWECGRCGGLARLLYLPVRLWTLPEYLGVEVGGPETVDRVSGPEAFGCGKCHGVCSRPVRDTVEAWNRLVGQVSSGLMYGAEVERPSWLTSGKWEGARPRKVRKRGPLKVARGRARGETAVRLREEGLTWREVGERMGVTPGGAAAMYRAMKVGNVRTGAGLPKKGEARARVLAARAAEVEGRMAEAEARVAAEWPGLEGVAREVVKLRLAGCTYKEVGRRLGVGMGMAVYYWNKYRRAEVRAGVGD